MIVRRRGSCSCRKVSWSSWRRAEKIRRRADADHVYFCPEAGGYHVTSWTRSDFDRITAARLYGGESSRRGVPDGLPANARNRLGVPLADDLQDAFDLTATTREKSRPHHRDDPYDVGGVAARPVVDRLPVILLGRVRTAKGTAPDDPPKLLEDVEVGHPDSDPGVVIGPDRQDVARSLAFVESGDPGPVGVVHGAPPDGVPEGYPPLGTRSGDNSGDILGASGGRENSIPETGDNVGESTATSAVERVGILLVGPEDGTPVRKCGGPTPDRADRQRSPNETRPRRESAVTLADVARPEPLAERDTPPEIPTRPDDVRPWDGWEDDDYERAS